MSKRKRATVFDEDKTYCASKCKNYACETMLSYSKVRAAEARGARIAHTDLSVDCVEFIK